MLDKNHKPISKDRRACVSFSENGMNYRGVNERKLLISMYKIDGGIISDNNKRCDNAFEVKELNSIYFIELKGEDIKKAATQIENTITILSNHLSGMSVYGRIVCSRAPRPDLRSSQIISLERVLMKMGGNLIKSCKTCEEKI
ncbi:hypothetical protein ABGV49_04880 [Chromobacterium vaccinii]|uniref:Uncharacterized protein n=1 Tax=Chromobacterium vaccinii TaxID=1108595 RepID=A0ABV0FAY5_9NEIS|nr:hypothetical protein [Chromobacterium vaccinii]MCD4500676.1 hypothetical protein [Chromobacterium vaccinii]